MYVNVPSLRVSALSKAYYHIFSLTVNLLFQSSKVCALQNEVAAVGCRSIDWGNFKSMN